MAGTAAARSPAPVWKRYNAFLRRAPEITIHWQDERTGARAWLVIDSLRGGGAGGGTRMRSGVDAREVTYLAKTMALKFAVCGPQIGGGKNGIDFDPADPRKPEVIERWYRVIRPYLRDHYGTGGDLNVDEVSEVIPTLQRLGIAHPQEGIVRGHMHADGDRFVSTIRNLDTGVQAAAGRYGIAGMPLTVSDMITGYGVARSVERWYAGRGRTLDGVRVLLEGFGNVGAACGLYLARAGARIVAVSDAEKTLVDPDGLDAAGIEDLFRRRRNRLLPEDPRARRGDRDAMWDTPAEIFIAAALSGTLDDARLDRLAAAGVRVIACGANQPFREAKLGSTRVQQKADRRFSILADVIANCGMARAFSYLMQPNAQPDADSIFAAVDATLADALGELHERVRDTTVGLLAQTVGISLDRIGA